MNGLPSCRHTASISQTDHDDPDTGSQEESAKHATPNNVAISTVAIDLAKGVFELAFAHSDARIVERRRLNRTAFARVLDNRPPLHVVMEACGSSHDWARRFARFGHAVELLPAHDVRPYVRRNKTDRTDAAGLLEAARCASNPARSGQDSMREVPQGAALVAPTTR